MIQKSAFFRYSELEDFTTKLDVLEDIRSFLFALSGQEYIAEIVRKRTGLDGAELVKHSAEAAAYVRVALEFLDQGREGPREIAALPLFYAVHNLSKLYISLGVFRRELPANRLHGVSYDPTRDTPPHLLDETISLKQNGVLSLLYKTLTHEPLTPVDLQLQNVYSYIQDVSAEYSICSGQPSNVLMCRAPIRDADASSIYPLVILLNPKDAERAVSAEHLPSLKQFTRVDNGTAYRGANVSKEHPDQDGEIRKQLRPSLLYHVDPYRNTDGTLCALPIVTGSPYMPEEIPIFLALFHLSSVVRYKPYLMMQLLQSRWSPLILGLQSHGLLKFLTLTWSFVYERSICFRHGY